MPTPGNHGADSAAPLGLQIGHPASSSPQCSRTVPWSTHLFSPTNIPQLDGAESFIPEQGSDIRVIPPEFNLAPPVHCECSQSTPLTPIQQLHPTQPPTQPVHSIPVPLSPLD